MSKFPEAYLSYLVMGYVFISEELALYQSNSALDIRKQFFDQGKQKFKQMSPNELKAFLQQNYPI